MQSTGRAKPLFCLFVFPCTHSYLSAISRIMVAYLLDSSSSSSSSSPPSPPRPPPLCCVGGPSLSANLSSRRCLFLERKDDDEKEEGCLGRMPPRKAALVEVAWRRPPTLEASARGQGRARRSKPPAIAASAVAAFIAPWGRCGRWQTGPCGGGERASCRSSSSTSGCCVVEAADLGALGSIVVMASPPT